MEGVIAYEDLPLYPIKIRSGASEKDQLYIFSTADGLHYLAVPGCDFE